MSESPAQLGDFQPRGNSWRIVELVPLDNFASLLWLDQHQALVSPWERFRISKLLPFQESTLLWIIILLKAAETFEYRITE